MNTLEWSLVAVLIIVPALLAFMIPTFRCMAHEREGIVKVIDESNRQPGQRTTHEEVVHLFQHLCKATVGLQCILDWGTLLGQVRDGSIIEHDYDVDMWFWERDVKTLEEKLRAYFTAETDYEVIKRRTITGMKPVFKVMHKPTSVSADLQVAAIRGDKWVRRHFPRLFQSKMTHKEHRDLPRDWILPLQERELEGHKVLIPAQPEKLLELYYGDTWKTPIRYK